MTAAHKNYFHYAPLVRDVLETPDGAILMIGDGKNGGLLRLTPAPAHAKK